jgi:hypothetical protein
MRADAVTCHTSLLELLTPPELQAVLAHGRCCELMCMTFLSERLVHSVADRPAWHVCNMFAMGLWGVC